MNRFVEWRLNTSISLKKLFSLQEVETMNRDTGFEKKNGEIDETRKSA